MPFGPGSKHPDNCPQALFLLGAPSLQNLVAFYRSLCMRQPALSFLLHGGFTESQLGCKLLFKSVALLEARSQAGNQI